MFSRMFFPYAFTGYLSCTDWGPVSFAGAPALKAFPGAERTGLSRSELISARAQLGS